MFLEIGSLIITHLVIPVTFLIWLWRGKDLSKLDWVAKLLVVALYSVHIFLSGRWDWFSYYLRFLLVIFFVLAAYKSLIKAKTLPLYPHRKFKNYLALGSNSLVVLLLLQVHNRML